MEVNDPRLADLVRRAESGERIFDSFDFSETDESYASHSTVKTDEYASSQEQIACEQKLARQEKVACRENIERLANITCGRGEKATAAFLVLMDLLENSANAKVLARMAKHVAFARCGELNLFRIVDAQIAAIERELWAEITPK